MFQHICTLGAGENTLRVLGFYMFAVCLHLNPWCFVLWHCGSFKSVVGKKHMWESFRWMHTSCSVFTLSHFHWRSHFRSCHWQNNYIHFAVFCITILHFICISCLDSKLTSYSHFLHHIDINSHICLYHIDITIQIFPFIHFRFCTHVQRASPLC